jgi:hypothetical protein
VAEQRGRSERYYESVVDQQIRQAEERGEFDDLPGLGKPLPGLGTPDDDLWWVKGYLQRENLPTEALLPTPLLLRREKERLPETVRDLPSEQAVREFVRAFNRRILAELRAPSGPWRPVGPANADELAAGWRAAHLPGPGTTDAGVPAEVAGEVAGESPAPWWRRLGRPKAS